ncbi:MAG: SGNH/GDSL hydrolase family protein [Candidatus Omnitrophica bacterium]|nr:SGNH/GDSL hydrolase family protein [Candidatus Omnitrophota bacterium]
MATQRMKFIKKFLQNTCLVILSISLFFIIVETTARALIKLGVTRRYSPIETQLNMTEDWRRANFTVVRYLEPDPELLWRPATRHPYNSQRFKGPEAAVPKPPHVFRIICYGDSNVDRPNRGSWPEQLQRIIDEKGIQRDWKCEVINAGVTGYSSYQGLIRFRSDVDLYEPDLIFVSFGWNDLPPPIGEPDNKFKLPPPIIVFLERIFLKSDFYLTAKNYFQKNRKSPAHNSYSMHRVSLKDYLQNLNDFLEIARARRVSIIFLTRPHALKSEEMLKLPSWEKDVPLYNRKLLEFSGEKNALAVDVEGIFEVNYSYLFSDKCHFTLEGHKKMAEILFQKLLEADLLPQTTP